MEEDSNGERISVEGKSFDFATVQNGYILKEFHKQGKRSLFLSKIQSIWIAEKLEARKNDFGEFKRKESKNFNGRSVVMIEGGNQKGVFLAIQVKENGKKCQYIIVPAGGKGCQWLRVAEMMRKAIHSPSPAEIHQSSIGNSGQNREIRSQEFNSSGKSYASVLQGSIEGDFFMLQRRIEDLEKELALLRAQTAAPNPNIGRKTMNASRAMDLDLTAVIESFSSRSECDCISRFLQRIFQAIPYLRDGDSNPDGIVTSGMGSSLGMDVADDGVFRKNQNEILQENSNGLKPTSNHGKNEGKNGQESECQATVNKESVTGIANESEFESKASNLREFEGSENEFSSREDHIDVPEDKIESDDSDDEYSSLNENEVYWDSINENYVHLSGMRFDPQRNKYFSMFPEKSDDFRCLYFVPKKGKFKLANKGELGDINRKILNDEDWEWSDIANSFRFPPNLLDLFRNKLVDHEISSM